MSAPVPRSEGAPSACAIVWRHLSSSVLPRVLPWSAIAAGYTVALHQTFLCQQWPAFCDPETEQFIFLHPYAYQGIMLASGFALVFRLNQSYNRYWEARTAMQNASAKWLDGINMSLIFDDDGDFPGGEKRQHAMFARCAVHLGSLLHALALHSLRGDTGLDTLVRAEDEPAPASSQSLLAKGCCKSSHEASGDFGARNPIAVLGGISPREMLRLAPAPQRAHLVVSWLTRLTVRRRRRGGVNHCAPIVSRIYQVVSDGNLWYLSALKVCDTPFPLAYAQISFLVCLFNLLLFPLVVADKVTSLPLAACISFAAITMLFGLNEVARDLEEPFQSKLGWCLGANRLDAPALQTLFNARLLALATASVCAPSWPGEDVATALGDDVDGAQEQELYSTLLEDALGRCTDIAPKCRSAPCTGYVQA